MAEENWLEKRTKRLEIDGYRCRGCNRSAEETNEGWLEVHHRKYFWQNPNNEPIEVDDLTTFCVPCHTAITNVRRELLYSRKDILLKDVEKVVEPKKEEGVKYVQDIKIQDYRETSPINAQRGSRRPIKSDY